MGIQVFNNCFQSAKSLRSLEETSNHKTGNSDISPCPTDSVRRPFAAVVVGGGLAGLSLSILLSRSGYKTVLFEKEKYPFHKVCGEYISMESWNFIEDLGLNLSRLHLPIIQKLIVSAPDGSFLNAPLDLGGFGISRFFLDNELKNIAIENGAIIY